MNPYLPHWVFVSLIALCLSELSFAQDAETKTAKASSSHKPERTLVYKSSFNLYRPYSNEKTANWKSANDEVGRIGGWRTYLKEAQEPEIIKPIDPHAAHGSK
jgi:hypothetical protein